jgi:hypothetical protein
MYLTKVPICRNIVVWDDQDFPEHCRNFGSNSLLTLPAWNTWHKVGGRMDSSAQNVAIANVGSLKNLLVMSVRDAVGVLRPLPAR